MISRFASPPDKWTRERLVLTHPSLWPCWPFLPIVRRTETGEDLGIVFDARTVCGLTGYSTMVLIANLFLMPHSLEAILALPREVFDGVEELLQGGWRID